MASDDRRTCPIFRVEPGTLKENHMRTLNYEYPSIHEDEDVFLRVTKLSSTNNSPLLLNKSHFNQGKSSLTNSNGTNRDSWDDTGRSLNDNNNNNNNNNNTTGRLHSLSDDYVFL